MENAPRRCHIVSHTHWDREWYLAFDEFRVDLVRVVGRVLDALEGDGAFRHFVLDGQTAVIDDHLAGRPSDASRIRDLVAAGRLSLGPWYVLPDEFLVDAESLSRNLLLGDRGAARFGPVQKVGYMPDSFGHVAQLPQILRRAGIDSFIHTRGNGDELDRTGWIYTWRAPDGSAVTAINQCGGYCNAGGLGFDEIWRAHTRREVDPDRAVARIRDLFAEMAARPGHDPALLNNGCDHFPPQQDFDRILDRLREAFPETEFIHSDFASYVDAVRETTAGSEIVDGELLGGKLHHILSGVWSARMPLKQENEACQTLLSGVLEPICAYAHFLHGQTYPADLIRHAWSRLLLNHPHDSICGCSIDTVHRDMAPRFAAARRTARRLLPRTLEDLAPNFGRREADDRETLLCIANPLPERRREIVTRMVALQPLDYAVEALRLFDAGGRDIPFTILEKRYVERFWGVDYRMILDHRDQAARFDAYRRAFAKRILKDGPGRDETGRQQHDCLLTIQFAADLPPCGHAVFRLREAPGRALAPEGSVLAGDGVLENDLLRVELRPDGVFDLLDKTSGRIFRNLGALEDTADIGDEYDYCPCPTEPAGAARVTPGRVRVLENTGLAGVLEADFTLLIPAALSPDRKRRSDETAECRARLRLELRDGSPRLDARLEIDNRAEDHRLRLLFPTPVRTDDLVSESHYLVQARPLIRDDKPDWTQPPPATWPQLGFSCLEDGSGGLALLNRGLPEIEGLRREGRAGMALTLLRCVGWLSRDDFPTRRHSNAGPTIPTPDAQCPGTHVFEYALRPYAGTWLDADVSGESRRWRCPPLVLQGVVDGHAPDARLLEAATRRTAVTAIKRSEDRDDVLIVRLCNLCSEPVAETLSFGRDLAEAWRSTLLEESGEPLETNGRELHLQLRPHEILTIAVCFRSDGAG